MQALNVGQTLTDTFTVTTVDGTAQVVTVTINGTNDAAVISGTSTGSVIEAGGVANATSRHADGDGHADRYRCGQHGQHLHGGRDGDGEHGRLRQLHDDGGWGVDLHAEQRERDGAGAERRPDADRHLHGDDGRRHGAAGDGDDQRHQRRGGDQRHQHGLSDRGRRRRQRDPGHADGDGHADRDRRGQCGQHVHGGGHGDGEQRAASAASR